LLKIFGKFLKLHILFEIIRSMQKLSAGFGLT